MPCIVTNESCESCLRDILIKEKYSLNKPRGKGETGVDIKATKNGQSIWIEVIGFKSSPPARSKDFYEVFFRAISRLKEGGNHAVIALPSRWGNGMHQRAMQYGDAWARIGQAFR